MIGRRTFLGSLLALAAIPARADDDIGPGLQLGDAAPWDPDAVREIARQAAQRPYSPPQSVPEAWTSINYDQYRLIVFDTRKAIWADDPSVPLQVDVFPPGLYFPKPVAIHVVDGDRTQPVLFDLSAFHNVDELPQLPRDGALGYSGLRLRAELETPGIYTEFSVFQGASYFRAIGTGQTYGLSARGLAIDTAAPQGEEFPDFTAFWVEKPAPGARGFVVHALLDSPSCTGVYRFEIAPGAELGIVVQAEVFARTTLRNYGLAPLTSMFKFDETNRDRFSDFRPAVHDTDGLHVATGAGETLWRPLANPRTLQISAFVDENPRGFGLMQRARHFDDYSDLEAHYHNRPGLWIEPLDDWGRGSVALIEIPTDREIYDNIVAYWRPSAALSPGQSRRFSYRQTWGARSDYGRGLPVLDTQIGLDWNKQRYIVAIDVGGGPEVPEDLSRITRLVRASTGTASDGIVQRNPVTGGPRLGFTFDPGDETMVEFRAQLWLDGAPLTEVWLYRWTV